MQQAIKKSRLARVVRRLVRCEAGGGDILTGIIMTGVGLLAVSQTLPPLRDAFNTAGDALKRQAHVLARGSDTGAVNGPSSSSGGSTPGFDFGAPGGGGGSAFVPANPGGTLNGAGGDSPELSSP